MNLSQRLIVFSLGCAFGYIIRLLQEIKKELDDVDECVKNCRENHDHTTKKRDEGGFMRHPLVADVAMLIVLALTVYAAFASQAATNKVQSTQKQITNIVACNRSYLSMTITALNERTDYTQDRAQANVELQKAQARYLNIFFVVPPKTDQQKYKALQKYLDTLTTFIEVSGKADQYVENNPYPSENDYQDCITKGVQGD